MDANPASTPRTAVKPAHEIRLGMIKAAIWANDTESGRRFNVTFSRLYQQDGEWRSTESFGRDDLLLLGKVADLSHSWIMTPAEANPKGGTTEETPLSSSSLPRRRKP